MRRRVEIVTESFVIEVGRKVVGIAVRNRGDYHFYSSERDFVPLENASYRRLRDVERAAAHVHSSQDATGLSDSAGAVSPASRF